MMRHAHLIHHLSHNPSPWAAHSFHPLEAIVEAGVLLSAAFIFPLHPYVALLFFVWMTFFNVLGHTGYDILPF